MIAPTSEEVAKLVSRLRDVEVLFGRNVAAGRHAGDAADALEAVQAAREAAERDAAAHAAAAALAERERLLEALRDLYRGYVSTLEVGRDRIIGLGGSCDPVDVMEARDPRLIAARLAIAEHPEPSGADALAAALRKARAEGMRRAARIAQERQSEGGEYALAAKHIHAAILAAAEAEERGE